MSDDLEKRLRGWAKDLQEGSTATYAMDLDLKIAADRIEFLETTNEQLVATCEALTAGRDALLKEAVDALRFYADKDNYEPVYERMPCDCCVDIYEPVMRDEGELARAFLAKHGEPI